MLSRWSIRNKLLIGLGLLLVIVVTLSWSGFYGLYSYRGLLKSLARVAELPLATELARRVSDLRVTTLSQPNEFVALSPDDARKSPTLKMHEAEVLEKLDLVKRTVKDYREQLERNGSQETFIGDSRSERETLEAFERTLARLSQDVAADEPVAALDVRLARLQSLATELPGYLQEKINRFPDAVRGQYRRGIRLAWATSVLTAILLGLFVAFMYRWAFRPLRLLIKGSRKVVAGGFNYRIRLKSKDEMAELADAMNDMTECFCAIRDDLDRKVQDRTQQVVRSVQLASVGYLAAGVAHDINRPLATIAQCADHLNRRLAARDTRPQQRKEAMIEDLQRIQSEAFCCKDITQNLLDFSRMGDRQRKRTDLRELAQGVIDIVGHIGKYQRKHILLAPGPAVFAEVNAQEMKTVVLSLLCKSLDSLEIDGQITVTLQQPDQRAELLVSHPGRGLSSEELEKLFDPSFACRDAGQAAGLGLSVSLRIVEDHGGFIQAASEGPNQGAQWRVSLPLVHQDKEIQNHHQA